MEKTEFKGKKCLLFGANSIIGKNLTEHFSKLGMKLGLIDLANKKFDSNLPYETVTPGDEESFKKAIDKISTELKGIDFLVLSYYFEDKLNFSLENPDLIKWDMIRKNWIDSYFLCVKNVLPHFMNKKFGRIVFLNSLAGYTGEGEGEGELITENVSIYEGAASSGITGIMTSVARQIIPSGVSMNGVAIGPNYMKDLKRINEAVDLWLSGICEYACGQIIRLY
jgi:NAD(P)-dependent dehydrogenase (short-subunit alcohol dehydrogenase family)